MCNEGQEGERIFDMFKYYPKQRSRSKVRDAFKEIKAASKIPYLLHFIPFHPESHPSAKHGSSSSLVSRCSLSYTLYCITLCSWCVSLKTVNPDSRSTWVAFSIMRGNCKNMVVDLAGGTRAFLFFSSSLSLSLFQSSSWLVIQHHQHLFAFYSLSHLYYTHSSFKMQILGVIWCGLEEWHAYTFIKNSLT